MQVGDWVRVKSQKGLETRSACVMATKPAPIGSRWLVEKVKDKGIIFAWMDGNVGKNANLNVEDVEVERPEDALPWGGMPLGGE